MSDPNARMRRETIAIVGIGCRFPAAHNPDRFWQLVHDGVDAVTDGPDDPWREAVFGEVVRSGLLDSARAGFIRGVDGIDWRALRISPNDARHLDPQIRVLLEVSWEAIDDAGLPFDSIEGSRAGVYVGMEFQQYGPLQMRDLAGLTGNYMKSDFACGPARIAYTFGLRGPALVMNAGCAGSLSAVHHACEYLQSGRGELALAGGVSLTLFPDTMIAMSRARMLSRRGLCRPLDTGADGIVFGEGAAVVVLKPLDAAVRDNDRIYATIRGSALNSNGPTDWFMASSTDAQEDLVRTACDVAGVAPADIDYVELHACGIPRADEAEFRALAAVVGAARDPQRPCRLGSVKSNIGHTQAAAGMAGLIKVALSLHHGVIPASLHVSDPVSLPGSGLEVQQTRTAWPHTREPPIAGVTALSMWGNNAHVLLQGMKRSSHELGNGEADTGAGTYVLPLSARGQGAMRQLLATYQTFLEQTTESIRDICYTAAARRTHHDERTAVTGATLQALARDLSRCSDPGATAHDSGSEHSQSLVQRYERGESLDWARLVASGCCVTLPTYPWQRQRMWLEGLAGVSLASSAHAPIVSIPRGSQGAGSGWPKSTVDTEGSAEEPTVLYLVEELAQLLGKEQRDISCTVPLAGLDVDSMAATQLQDKVERRLGVHLSLGELLGGASIRELAHSIIRRQTPSDSRRSEGADSEEWETGTL